MPKDPSEASESPTPPATAKRARPSNGATSPAKAPSATRRRQSGERSAADTSAADAGPALAREDRHVRISRAAYFRAELRGFAPGRELEDWYAAEAELNGQASRDA